MPMRSAAVQHEQGVGIRLEGRPRGPVRLGVHDREVVLLEHRLPPLGAPECERRGDTVPPVERPVPHAVELAVQTVSRGVLHDHQAAAGDPVGLGEQPDLILVAIHVVEHEQQHHDVEEAVGHRDTQGVLLEDERELTGPVPVLDHVGERGLHARAVAEPPADEAGPGAEIEERPPALQPRRDLRPDGVLPQEHPVNDRRARRFLRGQRAPAWVPPPPPPPPPENEPPELENELIPWEDDEEDETALDGGIREAVWNAETQTSAFAPPGAPGQGEGSRSTGTSEPTCSATSFATPRAAAYSRYRSQMTTARAGASPAEAQTGSSGRAGDASFAVFASLAALPSLPNTKLTKSRSTSVCGSPVRRTWKSVGSDTVPSGTMPMTPVRARWRISVP